MTTHWIGMAGLHGCLPQTCAAYDSKADAAEGLAQVHELGRNRTIRLRRDGYLELNPHRDGNDYAEIVACECSTPEVHNDE
jgi:hypothetical protein